MSDERQTYTVPPMRTGLTLAERLVLARSEAGLSQEEVARDVGMTQPSYSALERGESKRTTKIGSFARLFRVDAYWLETGEGEMRCGVAEQRGEYPSGDYLRIVDAVMKLNPRRRRIVLALLNDEGD